jgi:hypothetical protein
VVLPEIEETSVALIVGSFFSSLLVDVPVGSLPADPIDLSFEARRPCG